MPSSAHACAAAAPVNQSILSRVISDLPTSTLVTKPWTSPLRSVGGIWFPVADVVTVTVMAGVGLDALLVLDALGGFEVRVLVAVVRPAGSLVSIELMVGVRVPGAAVPPVEREQDTDVAPASSSASRDAPNRTS